MTFRLPELQALEKRYDASEISRKSYLEAGLLVMKKRRKELKKDRAELECFMAEWKKELTDSEDEKKGFAEATRILAESDEKMLCAEAKIVKLEKICKKI